MKLIYKFPELIHVVQVINRNYRVSMSVCLCVYVCVHAKSKNDGSINLKLEHIIIYGNCLCEFDIGHGPIKVKVKAPL